MAISPLALQALVATTALQPLAAVGVRSSDVLLLQIASTQVTLSSFGRLQAAASGLADAAAGLRAGSAPPDEATLATALERFLSAANTGRRVSDTLLLGRLASGLGIVDDTVALIAGSELFRGIGQAARNGGVDFASLGISLRPDGQLAFDRAAFAAAFAADPSAVADALDRLGAATEEAATAALAPGGGLASPPLNFELLFSGLQLLPFGIVPDATTRGLDDSAALLRLTSNPFLFSGVDAFRLIAGL